MEDNDFYWLPKIELDMLVGHNPQTANPDIDAARVRAEHSMQLLSLPRCACPAYAASAVCGKTRTCKHVEKGMTYRGFWPRHTEVELLYWTRRSQAKMYAGLGVEYGWVQKLYDVPNDATIAACREAIRLDHPRKDFVTVSLDSDLYDVMENRWRNVWPPLTDPVAIGNLLDNAIRL